MSPVKTNGSLTIENRMHETARKSSAQGDAQLLIIKVHSMMTFALLK